jgi:invasion protein IalB
MPATAKPALHNSRPVPMKLLIFPTLAIALFLMIQSGPPMANAQTQASASDRPELYENWTVTCASGPQPAACVMSQQQRKQATGQLVLAIELNDVSAQYAKGTIVFPFGLSLPDGAMVQVDDMPILSFLPFETCLPVGCIAPVLFDADTLAALRSGAILHLMTKAHDTGQPVRFTVSLKGFSAAQDRVTKRRETE